MGRGLSRLVALAVVLFATGCKDPIPLGPDLVACPCSCVTRMASGLPSSPTGCTTGGQCLRPCPDGRVCDTRGGCYSASCVAPPPPTLISGELQTNVHVCVDARNPTNAAQACSQRCSEYGSAQA